MCTAIANHGGGLYFGRTLDYHAPMGEELVVIPRNFPLIMHREIKVDSHYAIIGAALVKQDYPLLFDGMNEKGLCMAGLNFAGNAAYQPAQSGKINLAQFEFIPYILGKCAFVEEAVSAIKNINITPERFSADMPPAPLHWLIADKMRAVVVEFVSDGTMVYDDPAGVLTNNPPFPVQMANLANYMNLSPQLPRNNFSAKLNLSACGMGFGAIGLPGDMSPQSRFVRAAFLNCNWSCGMSEAEGVAHFFSVLGCVSVPCGCCAAEGGGYESTLYSSCCSAQSGMYYYLPRGGLKVCAVNMFAEQLSSARLARYSGSAITAACAEAEKLGKV